MKLSELRGIMAEIKQAIPAKKQQDDTVRIVDAEVFGNKGDYNFAIKKTVIDRTTCDKIEAIAEKHSLLLKNVGDYLILYRYKPI